MEQHRVLKMVAFIATYIVSKSPFTACRGGRRYIEHHKIERVDIFFTETSDDKQDWGYLDGCHFDKYHDGRMTKGGFFS